MEYRFLSHVVGADIPVYGGRGAVITEAVKSVARGDSANVHRFTMENHWGTHVDCPAHFFDGGLGVTDYAAREWVFGKPQVVQVKLSPSETLESGDWMDEIRSDTDMLLIRSGWSAIRGDDKYSLENPGIAPEAAVWLRRERPSVKVIGIDWISVSSYTNRPLGRMTHKAFLNPAGVGHPIRIVEDMEIPPREAGLSAVWVFPLRVEGLDGAPCTVVGGV